MTDEQSLTSLKDYLRKVPSIAGTIGSGLFENGCWWVKFTIDIDHDLAWRAVQELGYVLNYVSVDDRLPTVSGRRRHLPVQLPRPRGPGRCGARAVGRRGGRDQAV